MSLSIILIAYMVLAAILVITCIVALGFTWRFRYLGPATYFFVTIFLTSITINLALVTWYILRTDWTYTIGLQHLPIF